jgi:nucleoside phosphorylase
MPSPEPVDIAILIALQDEFTWLQEIFKTPLTSIPGSQNFYRCTFATDGKPYELVFALIGAMGPVQAAISTERLLHRYTPKLLVNIGIAGGIKDVCLGDVVISTQVSAYLENSKAVETEETGDYEFELSAEVYRCAALTATLMQNLPFSHPELYATWKAAGAEEFATISRPDEWRELIKDDRAAAPLEQRPARFRDDPEIRIGHTASGPLVAAADSFTKWLKKHSDRSYLCIEMEAAGMLASTSSAMVEVEALVIRGISDFSDKGKAKLEAVTGNQVRRLAMHNAVRVFEALLKTGLLPRQDAQGVSTQSEMAKQIVAVAEPVQTEPVRHQFLPDITEAHTNPHYVEDLRSLQINNYKLDQLIGQGTIVVAVGREWPQDIVDRPVASWIGEVVDRYFKLYPEHPFFRSIVVSDVAAETQFIRLAGGLISIGGPNVNKSTVRIAAAGQVRTFPDGLSMCFVKDSIPQVALWGGGGGGTRASTERYVRHQDGLAEFMRRAIETGQLGEIEHPADGAQVGKTVLVRGRVAGLPSSLKLWLMSVSRDGGDLHPHGSPIVPNTTGEWAAAAFLGDQRITLANEPFRVKLIGVSKETSDSLQLYLSSAAVKGYSGVAGIPHRVLASIRVVRNG